MLRGYRSYIVAAFGIALLVAACVGYGLVKQAEYADSAQYQTANYAKNAADQITKSCFRLAPNQQAGCLRDGAEKYRLDARDKQREYDDLIAQRTSALWTMIMGVAALLGMALSVVGVALVWTTFQATREANRIALRALESQDRPWINFKAMLKDAHYRDNVLSIDIELQFENIGNSPATLVSYCILTAPECVPSDLILNSWLFFHDAESDHAIALFPNEPWIRLTRAEQIVEPGNYSFTIAIAVRYRTANAIDFRYTYRIYDLRDFVTKNVIKVANDARMSTTLMVAEREYLPCYAT